MHVVVSSGDGDREVAVDLRSSDATVADLLRALGLVGDVLQVDGRVVAADVPVVAAGIPDGAVLSPAGPSSPAAARPAAAPFHLTVVAGAMTGARCPLVPGRTHRIGRDPASDLRLDDGTVSLQHADVMVSVDGAVRIADAGSRNGTWLGGQALIGPARLTVGDVVRLGASVVRLDGPDPDDRPRGLDEDRPSGTRPFNRPPRPAPPRAPDPIPVPGQEPDPPPRRPFNLVAVVAPLVMGGAMVWFTGNVRFALFMLLSPLMAIGNGLSSRRHDRRQARTDRARHAEAMATFTTALEGAAAAARRSLEHVLPDNAEITRRATLPSTALWQRRAGHPDMLRLRLGSGDRPWEPPLEASRQDRDTDVATLLCEHAALPSAPIDVDLSVVGIVGPRAPAVALARSLVCQAAVLHGPVDVPITVCTHPEARADWEWALWLPHTRTGDGRGRTLTATSDDGRGLLDHLIANHRAHTEARAAVPLWSSGDTERHGPARLCVIDDRRLLEGRAAAGRRVLQGAAGPVAGLVLAPSEDDLPAVCTTVVRLRDDGRSAIVTRPQQGARIDPVLPAPMSVDQARRVARALARFEDPELNLAGFELPKDVGLASLLGLAEITGEVIGRAWLEGLPDPPPATPIGVAPTGPVVVDLQRDGPHGLVGGTTGAGKSELLRTLVAGLAARVGPEHLVFVLVDYKGGSAFDEVADLPHTVGLVTDLDEHLGERALRSLDAELHRRERILRDAAAADLGAYRAAGSPRGPLPRLVVVIDEFATLAVELPDFLGALVGIAQRGRSLGVHLVLATQRPQGAVSGNITANTNLRVALRVQDPADSNDLIDRPDAAELSRDHPGRAYLRRGPGEVELFQSARCTGPADGEVGGPPLAITPLRFGPVPAAFPEPPQSDGPTELSRLVAACRDAFVRSRGPTPRRPWLPMLAADVCLTDVLAAADDDPGTVPFALADDPDAQAQYPVGWRPAAGHLAVFGMLGAGTTTTLLAVAASLAQRHPPATMHLYALDYGDGGLTPLDTLQHTGTVVAAGDREGPYRLLRMLAGELDRRRGVDPRDRDRLPRIVVLVDGVGAFLAEHDGLDGAATRDAFDRVFAEGAAVGITFAVAGERPGALPSRLLAQVSQRLLLRLADPGEFAAVGLRPKRLPEFVPGRGILADGLRVVQVADPAAALAAAATTGPDDGRVAARVRLLPRTVDPSEIAAAAAPAGDGAPIRIPIGIGDDDLATHALALHPSDHVLVAGPPRSGRTSALQLLSAQLRVAVPDGIQVAITDPSRSALHGYPSLDGAGPLADFGALLDAAVTGDRPFFFLVDDAGTVDDPDGRLTRLLRAGRAGVHVFAAMRTGALRGGYGHWSRAIRQCRTGLLLMPDLATDGDAFAIRLPRRLHVPLVPGRGFAVAAGEPTLVQVALPPGTPRIGTILS